MNTKRDIVIHQLKKGKRETDKKYRELIQAISDKEIELQSALDIKSNVSPTRITRVRATKESEATVFMIASDWHSEERVFAKTVNGLNVYNLRVAEKRAKAFFRNGVKLIYIIKKDVRVDTLVLALLGDFISGSIHEELLAGNQLPPIDAIMFAQNLIAGGIEYILENTDLNIILPCHCGN